MPVKRPRPQPPRLAAAAERALADARAKGADPALLRWLAAILRGDRPGGRSISDK
jgi:hypothetical protein